MIELRFVGNWPLWLGLASALGLAAAAFWIYHRQLQSPRGATRLLPWLRALTVLFAVLLLIEPVVHHRRFIGEVGRVLLMVDQSQSMTLTDEQTPVERKLRECVAAGWLDAKVAGISAEDWAEDLRRAGEPIARLLEQSNASPQDWTAAAIALEKSGQNLRSRITSADDATLTLLDTAINGLPSRDAAGASDRRSRMESLLNVELLTPLRDTLAQPPDQDAERRRRAGTWLEAVRSWHQRLESLAAAQAQQTLQRKDATVTAALRRWDSSTRLQRVESLLTQGPANLLQGLGQDFDVQLLGLHDGQSHALLNTARARQTDPKQIAAALAANTPGTVTDLSTSLASLIDARDATRTIVVLLTDGRHNQGVSPVQPARILGARGLPVFPIALGHSTPAPDLALASIQAPASVFFEDRLTGSITLLDTLKPGQPLKLTATWDGVELWQQTLTSSGLGARLIPFDLPVKAAVESRLGVINNQSAVSVPMSLRFTIAPVQGERTDTNNVLDVDVRVVTRWRRALLIDGRPRWEFRYLRNLLERDPRWRVRSIDASTVSRDSLASAPPKPATDDGKIPAPAQDLIVLGDVPLDGVPADFPNDVRRFVSAGGGLVLIDGQRSNLSSWQSSAISDLLPVRWRESTSTPAAAANPLTALKLTDTGRSQTWLRLTPTIDDSVPLWSRLGKPRWFSPIEPLPGATVLLEGVHAQGIAPLLVWRRYGAGRVLVATFDESWRWRQDVADRYHQRYWNQLAEWVMEPPYAVQGREVWLDTDAVRYEPGQAMGFRVKLLDERGRARETAAPPVLKIESVEREQRTQTELPLTADPERAGVFQGQLTELPPGRYRVLVPAEWSRNEPQMIETSFVVRGQPSAEITETTSDETLLRAIAQSSGGQFLREDQAAALPDLLERYRAGKIVDVETPLSQSWWWFAPIAVLLSIEWWLRRRAGLL